jgi:hypothetical protein
VYEKVLQRFPQAVMPGPGPASIDEKILRLGGRYNRYS